MRLLDLTSYVRSGLSYYISASEQLPQPALQRLLIRLPGALEPCLDLAPLDFRSARKLCGGCHEPRLSTLQSPW